MRPGLTTLVSFRPDGSQGRALAQYGRISPPVYSYATPGGCNQLTATFARPPRYRIDALDPGRILRGYRGGGIVWEGSLDEPAPGQGWAITAHGAGAYGNDYRAIWTGTWGTGTPDQVVNNAIGRGLDWVNPGIGAPSDMWLGQQADTASVTVTDILNLVCTKGGLTWIVATTPRGNVLSVVPLPTAPNRLLVVGSPLARSVAAGPTTLYLRYQATTDAGNTPATFGLTSVSQAGLEAAAGRKEDWDDLSSAGTLTAGAAQAVGNQVLKKWQRVTFTDAVTARRGALLNLGGTPVDPGCFYTEGQTGMVCKLLLADYTPAGDVVAGAPAVLVGGYEWDDLAMTATITPAESLRHDFAGLMSMIVDTRPAPRTRPTSTPSKTIHH